MSLVGVTILGLRRHGGCQLPRIPKIAKRLIPVFSQFCVAAVENQTGGTELNGRAPYKVVEPATIPTTAQGELQDPPLLLRKPPDLAIMLERA